MSTLNKLLSTLSTESDEVVIDRDGMVDATADAVVSTFALPAVSDDLVDLEELEDESEQGDRIVNHLMGAQESLEAKVVMLQDMQAKGENLNASAAAMYARSVTTSMEAYEFPEELYSPVIDEMTVSFESVDSYDYSTEALEKTKELANKTWEMLKAAWASLIKFLKGLYVKVKPSLASIQERVTFLKKELAKPENATLKLDTISSKGLGILIDTKGGFKNTFPEIQKVIKESNDLLVLESIRSGFAKTTRNTLSSKTHPPLVNYETYLLAGDDAIIYSKSTKRYTLDMKVGEVDGKLMTMNAGTAKLYLDSVENIINVFNKSIDTNLKELESTEIDVFLKEFGDEDNKADVKRLITGEFSSMMMARKSLDIALSKAIISTSNATLKMVERSLNK